MLYYTVHTLSFYFSFHVLEVKLSIVTRIDYLQFCRSKLVDWQQLFAIVIWTQYIAICYHDGHTQLFYDTWRAPVKLSFVFRFILIVLTQTTDFPLLRIEADKNFNLTILQFTDARKITAKECILSAIFDCFCRSDRRRALFGTAHL